MPGEEIEMVEIQLSPNPPIRDVQLTVSNGKQDHEEQYQTALIVESDAAPGFAGGPGRAGNCSGVLIANDLVLTAAHCMCMQPIKTYTNKTLDRASCATHASVKKYLPVIKRSKTGGITSFSVEYPDVSGSAFLPEEFKVEIDGQGNISSIRADVAVIRLDSRIDVKIDHKPADRETMINDRITVVGFGGTSDNDTQFSQIRRFGSNTVTGIRLLEYEPRPSPSKQYQEFYFHRDYEANTQQGDSGGPCFREDKEGRWLVGIMLKKISSSLVKTSCLDLFRSKALIERLIQKARAETN